MAFRSLELNDTSEVKVSFSLVNLRNGVSGEGKNLQGSQSKRPKLIANLDLKMNHLSTMLKRRLKRKFYWTH
jgi:hypothetical protein